MSSKKQGLRDWHSWISVVLVVPIVIVSATAVLIAHERALGLKQAPVSLPGGFGAQAAEAPDVRAAAQTASGEYLVATNKGLLVKTASGFAPVKGVAVEDFRTVAAYSDTVVAAGKGGVWLKSGQGDWSRVLKGDAWWAVRNADGSLSATVKDKGLMVSDGSGSQWKADKGLKSDLVAYAANAPPEPLTMHKLVMDLHTGKFFFGKTGEWIWIDAVGGVMLFLSFSGLIIWMRARRRRRQIEETHDGAPALMAAE